MNLPRLAVGRPVMTTMIFLGVMILGVVSFSRLQVDLLPDIDFPSISVSTTYEGAGPEEIETLITRPMEEAIGTVEGIDSIESFSTEGRSRVSLRFVWGTDLDTAMNDVRSTVEDVRSRLPEDADNPSVHRFDLGSFPILRLSLSGDMSEPALRRLSENQLEPRLERVEGVASVGIRGGLDREFQVLLDTERLQAFNLSATEISNALGQENQNIPAGDIERHEEMLLVRVIGESEDVDDLQSIVVGVRTDDSGNSVPIYLGDVADVLDTYEDPSNIVRIDGEPGIRLSVTNRSGTNTVEVAEAVREEIERINRDYEDRAELTVVTDTSEYIEDSIANVQGAVVAGAVLAVLILLFFLRSLRSTLIIGVSIPISIIGIFTLMYYFDITLNLISFGGVALGVGLLVDNAIVILENIFRKLEEGEESVYAAIEGSREVSGAIVASTITTLVVFVPVIFLTGFASIFFGQMAFVVSFALVCSLAVALTLIPMLSSRFLHAEEVENGGPGSIGRFLDAVEQTYGNLVDWCLDHTFTTLGIAAVAFVGAVMLAPQLGTELLPEDDQSEVRVNLDMPEGTKVDRTERELQRLEAVIVQEIPEMTKMQTIAGNPGQWSTSGGESGRVTIQLVPPNERDRSSEEVAADLSPKIDHLVAGGDVRTRAGGGLWILRVLQGGGERLEVQVRGYDLDGSYELASEVSELMESVDGVMATNISRDMGGAELQVTPDREKLGSMGIEPSVVARQIQTYIQRTRATVMRADGDEFDVVVRLPEQERQGMESLLEMPVVIPEVGTVRLGDVATIEEAEGPLTIERENQGRIIDIRANLSGERALGDIAAELRDEIGDMDVPDEFTVLVRGETEEQEETFEGLLIGLLLATLLVYMVMASQFESFIQPVYIMCSIPVAAIGVIVMLLLTNTTFNIQSFMGCIMLTGIVVNNAIVLVDYVNLMRRERGMVVRQAVAISARRRLRPILMTTVTTMLALTPVALGLGEGGDTQAPLARAVIGGLCVSGAISLVIIPVIYDFVEGWREGRKKSSYADGQR